MAAGPLTQAGRLCRCPRLCKAHCVAHLGPGEALRLGRRQLASAERHAQAGRRLVHRSATVCGLRIRAAVASNMGRSLVCKPNSVWLAFYVHLNVKHIPTGSLSKSAARTRQRQHPPTWDGCAAPYIVSDSWLGAKWGSGMAVDRAWGAWRPVSAGMVVGCDDAAGAIAAAARGPASGCCPRPSQGIGPGSVSPWWPPWCLQRAGESSRAVRERAGSRGPAERGEQGRWACSPCGHGACSSAVK